MFHVCLPYLLSATLWLLERLLTLLELPPLLRLSPPSLSRSLSPLLELRLEVPLTDTSEREPCAWGSWMAGEEVMEGAAPVLVPMDLDMTLSLWELGL